MIQSLAAVARCNEEIELLTNPVLAGIVFETCRTKGLVDNFFFFFLSEERIELLSAMD